MIWFDGVAIELVVAHVEQMLLFMARPLDWRHWLDGYFCIIRLDYQNYSQASTGSDLLRQDQIVPRTSCIDCAELMTGFNARH